MATVILNKMNYGAVEQYLEQGGNTIFVGVGTCEMHGIMPLDCEAVLAEAVAVRLAEQTNSLALINIPFTYAGATAIGRGTVEVSIHEGYNYLKSIAHNLLKQGFRRQIYISAHGAAYLTLNALVSDFFTETKCPILHMDFVHAVQQAAENGFDNSDFFDMIYGAYGIMGQADYLCVDPHWKGKVPMETEKNLAFANCLGQLAKSPGNYGFYYRSPLEHAFETPFATVEERDAHIENGIRAIDRFLSYQNFSQYLATLDRLDEITQEEIRVAYPHLF